MNLPTEQHLAAIVARCRAIAAGDYRPDTSFPAGLPSVARAMALSTISAIEGLMDSNEYTKERDAARLRDIIAAWPEELL